ncbi:hypothetical protein AGMMS49928_16450 [Spirochaetia bacterium]|nr:hypothetical protein AGMMS49928_16450 [Spirochaetia bacterium]
MVLVTDKAEITAHLGQEGSNVIDYPCFKFRFTVFDSAIVNPILFLRLMPEVVCPNG